MFEDYNIGNEYLCVMDNKELNQTLRSEGRLLGMCDEFYYNWKNYTEEELAEKMYQGLDFILKNHWPSNEFLAKNFQLDFRRLQGVFVDDKYSSSGLRNGLVLGESTITLRYSARQYGNICLRDTSSTTVYARGNAFVLFHLFDKAKVYAEVSDKAKVVFIKHSHDVDIDYMTIDAGACVDIKEEYDYLCVD